MQRLSSASGALTPPCCVPATKREAYGPAALGTSRAFVKITIAQRHAADCGHQRVTA